MPHGYIEQIMSVRMNHRVDAHREGTAVERPFGQPVISTLRVLHLMAVGVAPGADQSLSSRERANHYILFAPFVERLLDALFRIEGKQFVG